jgi:hypothetical protein
MFLMRASEAARIAGLLAARLPPVIYEEATIEGVRMLVIIGKDVDSVIRFTRAGSADIPQVSTYPEVAESAVHADEILARQRASGRRNTTGEGNDWPRDWKLDKAKAVGKIWYAEDRPNRLSSKPTCAATPKVSLSHTTPTVGELRKTHEEYKRTVPNNYANTIHRVEAALSRRNSDELATAVAEWLQDLNRQYYRFRPEEAATLVERLKPILREELSTFLKFRERSIATLTNPDKTEVLRLFDLLRAECGPVGAGKALHVLAPNFFPLWDNPIAESYGVATETGYFQFINIVKQQVVNVTEEIAPGVTALKALDEYNYLRASATRKGAHSLR